MFILQTPGTVSPYPQPQQYTQPYENGGPSPYPMPNTNNQNNNKIFQGLREKAEETAHALINSPSGDEYHSRENTQIILIESHKGEIENPEKDIIVFPKAA